MLLCAWFNFFTAKYFSTQNWRHNFQKSWEVVCSFIFEETTVIWHAFTDIFIAN